LPLSLDALGDTGVDWYVGNCHKWLCLAVQLYVATPEASAICIRRVSNFYGEGFQRIRADLRHGSVEARGWCSA
jgi:hypothetical protein